MKKTKDIIDCIWSNNNYYILKKNTIEIYDKNENHIKTILIDKNFSSITYDDKDNVFYLSHQDDNRLYQSCDFKKFSPINDLALSSIGKIRKISYCKCFHSILITSEKRIFIFDLCKKRVKKIFELNIITETFHDCMRPLGCNLYPTLIDAVCCDKYIYILYRDNNESHIGILTDGKIEETVYKTYFFVNNMLIIDNELWVLTINDCNYCLVNTGITCSCGSYNSKDCKCEIIESIASMEKSLSKILNSEALKIKSAIDNAEKVEDLICVNSSVNETIYYITFLEFLLVEKLKTVNNTNDCCKKEYKSN